MRIALVQQHATHDRHDNLERGLLALEEAAADGAELVCYAELAFEPFYPQRPAEEDPKGLPKMFRVRSPRPFRSAPRSSVLSLC